MTIESVTRFMVRLVVDLTQKELLVKLANVGQNLAGNDKKQAIKHRQETPVIKCIHEDTVKL